MFHMRLAELYETRGIEFLNDLREAGIVEGMKYRTASELMMRLEKVAPGFQGWASLLEREDRQ